ncbi:hypothetical protein OnM2_029011 [Erysiphe neolycopersici]|uniref:Uncharacterized protein n=1 Tax=Erysiphe neolycopersici TaxID=212602 RepID=A0A420HZX7_9PEZI|nr:hypothetical protein OnM2_029011 [Erysiphe neolycopersici]
MVKNNLFPNLNPDEILLDMGDKEYEEIGLNSQLNIHCEKPNEENCIDEPSIRSSAMSTQESEVLEMQQRIDALLASIGSLPKPNSPERMLDDANPNLWTGDLNDGTLQSKSESWPLLHSRAARGDSQHDRSRRPFNEFWYLDYYDPSFNEDPWESLEKKS